MSRRMESWRGSPRAARPVCSWRFGKLTRGLHNAMLTIRLDARLIGITKTDIPDAKERLNAVITKTEEAAHRTLNAR